MSATIKLSIICQGVYIFNKIKEVIMFNLSKKHSFTTIILAGAASALVSASAAFAAEPYQTQGAQLQPQTQPVYVEYQSTYTRTERPVAPTAIDSARVYDHDMATATTMPVQPQEQIAATVINPNGIRYISGGIGADEQARIEAAQAQYPVKLVFADSNGAYMSNVDVTVSNASTGETVLGLQTDGPILLMDLKPGNYTVKANDKGQVKTQQLTVSDARKTYTMHFKASGPQDYSMTTGE
jgi:hypothetical protein